MAEIDGIHRLNPDLSSSSSRRGFRRSSKNLNVTFCNAKRRFAHAVEICHDVALGYGGILAETD